jgi:protein SCO1
MAVLPAKEAGQGGVPKRCTSNRPAIGGPFKLYDIENNVVTESELRGNWTLMYFGYTSCPDVGPRQVQKIADVVKVLGELCIKSCMAEFLFFKTIVSYSHWRS